MVAVCRLNGLQKIYELQIGYQNTNNLSKERIRNYGKITVKKVTNKKDINVEVPGSKSITNRALMLAAISNGKCKLSGILFSDDSRAFLDCLDKLGFKLEIDENAKTVVIQGENGRIPNNEATINVRSAGTAARFMTVLLAVCGGKYTLESLSK